nr:hypothetical protein [Limosilactobacillus vaginalis]
MIPLTGDLNVSTALPPSMSISCESVVTFSPIRGVSKKVMVASSLIISVLKPTLTMVPVCCHHKPLSSW